MFNMYKFQDKWDNFEMYINKISEIVNVCIN